MIYFLLFRYFQNIIIFRCKRKLYISFRTSEQITCFFATQGTGLLKTHFCFVHTSSLHWNAAEVQYFDLVWRQTKFLYEYECIRSSQHSSRTLEAFTFFMKRLALSCVCSTWCFRRWRSNSTGLTLRNFETCEVVQHFIARSCRCWHEHLNAANSPHLMQFLRRQAFSLTVSITFSFVKFRYDYFSTHGSFWRGVDFLKWLRNVVLIINVKYLSKLKPLIQEPLI